MIDKMIDEMIGGSYGWLTRGFIDQQNDWRINGDIMMSSLITIIITILMMSTLKKGKWSALL